MNRRALIILGALVAIGALIAVGWQSRHNEVIEAERAPMGQGGGN